MTFIEQYADDRAISLRLLEPSFRKVIYARSESLDWRPLVLNQLKSLGARKTRHEGLTPRHRRSARCIRQSSGFLTPWLSNRPTGRRQPARVVRASSGSFLATAPADSSR